MLTDEVNSFGSGAAVLNATESRSEVDGGVILTGGRLPAGSNL